MAKKKLFNETPNSIDTDYETAITNLQTKGLWNSAYSSLHHIIPFALEAKYVGVYRNEGDDTQYPLISPTVRDLEEAKTEGSTTESIASEILKMAISTTSATDVNEQLNKLKEVEDPITYTCRKIDEAQGETKDLLKALVKALYGYANEVATTNDSAIPACARADRLSTCWYAISALLARTRDEGLNAPYNQYMNYTNTAQVTTTDFVSYKSKANNNRNNPLTDTTKWQRGDINHELASQRFNIWDVTMTALSPNITLTSTTDFANFTLSQQQLVSGLELSFIPTQDGSGYAAGESYVLTIDGITKKLFEDVDESALATGKAIKAGQLLKIYYNASADSGNGAFFVLKTGGGEGGGGDKKIGDVFWSDHIIKYEEGVRDKAIKADGSLLQLANYPDFKTYLLDLEINNPDQFATDKTAWDAIEQASAWHTTTRCGQVNKYCWGDTGKTSVYLKCIYDVTGLTGSAEEGTIQQQEVPTGVVKAPSYGGASIETPGAFKITTTNYNCIDGGAATAHVQEYNPYKANNISGQSGWYKNFVETGYNVRQEATRGYFYIQAIIDSEVDYAKYFKFNGSVATIADLPTDASDGDIYIVTAENEMYCYSNKVSQWFVCPKPNFQANTRAVGDIFWSDVKLTQQELNGDVARANGQALSLTGQDIFKKYLRDLRLTNPDQFTSSKEEWDTIEQSSAWHLIDRKGQVNKYYLDIFNLFNYADASSNKVYLKNASTYSDRKQYFTNAGVLAGYCRHSTYGVFKGLIYGTDINESSTGTTTITNVENGISLSGFSSTTYCNLNKTIDTSKAFTLQFKFSTTSISTNARFIGSQANAGFGIGLSSSKLLLCFSTDGTAWSYQAGSTTLLSDTTYYVRVTYNLTQFIVEISTDGTTFTTEITYTTTIFSSNNNLGLGALYSLSSSAFTYGTIYLDDFFKITNDGATIYQVEKYTRGSSADDVEVDNNLVYLKCIYDTTGLTGNGEEGTIQQQEVPIAQWAQNTHGATTYKLYGAACEKAHVGNTLSSGSNSGDAIAYDPQYAQQQDPTKGLINYASNGKNVRQEATRGYYYIQLKPYTLDWSKTFRFKGIVENYSDLPSTLNTNGDVYYVKNDDGTTHLKGNYVWGGSWCFIGNENYVIYNPFALGMLMRSKATLSNPSWLKSDGVAKEGATYTGMYDKLVDVNTTGTAGTMVIGGTTYNTKEKDGIVLLSSTDWLSIYSNYGIVQAFGLDTTNTQFYLPFGEESKRVLIEKKEPTDADKTWYNLYSDGWVEQGGIRDGNYPTAKRIQTLLKEMRDTNYTITTTTTSPTDGNADNRASYVITTTLSTTQFSSYQYTVHVEPFYWVVRGYTNETSALSINYYDYYYVGNTLQDVTAINIANVLSELATLKAYPHIIRSVYTSTIKYEVYSNGMCKQWGEQTNQKTNKVTITLALPYLDTTYNVMALPTWDSSSSSSSATADYLLMLPLKTTTGFSVNSYGGGSDSCIWQTYGKIDLSII